MNTPPKILCVVGARPNFIKIAPIMEAITRSGRLLSHLIHPGQHFDARMSHLFFTELGIPQPDIYLNVGTDTINRQMARIMMELDPVLNRLMPDVVLVVGDVTSTLAAAITATRYHIPVGHVEAGLRSRDRSMPEEINRILTDTVSDFLFTTGLDAGENLKKEGVSPEKIFFVGNVMIDTLLTFREMASHSGILKKTGLVSGQYAVLTLHRPSNVDDSGALMGIIETLEKITREIAVLFPVHPRTRQRLKSFGLEERLEKMTGLVATEPLSYLNFLCALSHARLVLTDSGGIQEETTILDIPCLTLRENTERPVTITEGTNELVGNNPERICEAFDRIMAGKKKQGRCPELWDGKAAERIVSVLEDKLCAP